MSTIITFQNVISHAGQFYSHIVISLSFIKCSFCLVLLQHAPNIVYWVRATLINTSLSLMQSDNYWKVYWCCCLIFVRVSYLYLRKIVESENLILSLLSGYSICRLRKTIIIMHFKSTTYREELLFTTRCSLNIKPSLSCFLSIYHQKIYGHMTAVSEIIEVIKMWETSMNMNTKYQGDVGDAGDVGDDMNMNTKYHVPVNLGNIFHIT